MDYQKTIAIIALFFAAAATAQAFDDGDFQVWHTENQEFKVNKNSKITTEEEFRFGDSSSDFYYQHYDIGYVYGLNRHLDLGVNYRQVFEKKGNRFMQENRPHINATVKWDFHGFKFDDRNRLEYRDFYWQEDFWRYRNKIAVKFPWKFTKLEIQPYLADEIFIKLNGIDLNRNRWYVGFGFNILAKLKGDIFYLLQTSKSNGRWANYNVLGTKLKLNF